MTQQQRILIVDDDPIVADSIAQFFQGENYLTATANNGKNALAIIDQANNHPFSLVITDLNMPTMDGLELLKILKKQHPDVASIVITGFGKIETAVEAVKLGAVDYLTKPIIDDELRISVKKAMQQHILLAENKHLKDQLDERFGMGSIVGNDHKMQKVYELVDAVAQSRTTVLINGESGTGKSMIAHAVHTQSPRKSEPFITFACGSIPETLLESELFGHVKGAFTGADHDKAGKCLLADGGTLFIDEINSATPTLQLKLLRILQEKCFEPIGAAETKHVDIRFILATNQSLEDLVKQGTFREDLYYRINVVNMMLPPLRERTTDIPLLAQSFLKKYNQETSRNRVFSEDALDTLCAHDWPGNVRELENAVERAVVLSRDTTILPEHFPDTVHKTKTPGLKNLSLTQNSDVQEYIPALTDGWTPTPLNQAMQFPESLIIKAALEANDWNRQATAKELDINRTTLYKKIKQYKLDQPA